MCLISISASGTASPFVSEDKKRMSLLGVLILVDTYDAITRSLTFHLRDSSFTDFVVCLRSAAGCRMAQ